MEKHKLIHDLEKHQYEYHIDGNTPRVEYILSNDRQIYITHTEVPSELEGRGIASALVEDVLCELDREGARITPICPFVSGYIRKNPDWKRLLMDGIDVE